MPESDQRWRAIASEQITEAILELREDPEFLARFRAKIDTRNAGDDECDIWTGAMSSEGYGVIRLPQSRSFVVRAHRVAFMLARGPVPEDRPILDHVYPLCRYRFCVNEWHLEPVTQRVNDQRRHGTGRAPQRVMRYEAIAARNAAGSVDQRLDHVDEFGGARRLAPVEVGAVEAVALAADDTARLASFVEHPLLASVRRERVDAAMVAEGEGLPAREHGRVDFGEQGQRRVGVHEAQSTAPAAAGRRVA